MNNNQNNNIYFFQKNLILFIFICLKAVVRSKVAAAMVDTYGAGAAAARQRGMRARSVVRERFAAAAVARRVTAQLESMACEKLAAFGSVGSANFDDAWRRASDWRSQSSPAAPSKVKIQIND